MSEWKKVKLGDISLDIQTGPFGSQLHQSDYSKEGIPVVMPKDMEGGIVKTDSIARVEEHHAKRLSRYKISEGDILYARRGDVGKCVYTTKDQNGWLCGTGCLRVTINKELASPKFIFFQLQKRETVGWVEKHAVGATMLNLNTSILGDVPVEYPSLSEQNRIVDILSRYDSLIENYQKQIKLLEEAAQRLYKEWFVDLRFPGYEKVKVVNGVPEGWERKKLGEIIELDPKVPLAKERVKQFVPMQALSVNSMVMDQTQFSLTTSNSGSKFQNGDTLLARITPCLENGKTAYVNCIESNEGGIGSTEYIVMRSLCYSKYMVYLLARSYKFREYAIKCMSGSDGRQRVQKDKLSLYMICVPPKNLIAKFDCFAKPIFAKIKNLSSQIRKLTESRDRMLVKLMSGEIEV